MTQTPTVPTATYSQETLDRYAGDDSWMNKTNEYIGDLEGGFRAKPYRVKNNDGSFGNLTIGHGFEYIDGKPITEDMTLTEEESNQILNKKIVELDSFFMKYPAYENATPNQKGAIVSFAYNLGQNVVDDPDNRILRKAMKSGDMNQIAKAMILYNKGSNGKRNEGLVNRRNDEVQMLLKNNNRGFSYDD